MDARVEDRAVRRRRKSRVKRSMVWTWDRNACAVETGRVEDIFKRGCSQILCGDYHCERDTCSYVSKLMD